MTNKLDNINKKIGLKIKLERAKRNFSQEKLAELSDLSKNYIGDIEKGKSSPTIETLAKIANAFDIELHDLTNISKVDI
jgi:transcriptional regulator with XRE-family HTH domain